jgi:hypothetical protein
MENKMENTATMFSEMFQDVSKDIIDNEFPIEQEFDGMFCAEFSDPIVDLDFETEINY